MIKLFTDRGVYTASVPSGTSRGTHEAVELPLGRVFRAFSEIRPKLIGKDEKNQELIDGLLKEYDGTENFSRIGGNLSLAISVAAAKASKEGALWKFNEKGLHATFPLPVLNVIGGGKHGGRTDWQEFLVIPHRTRDPQDAFESVIDFWGSVGEELKKKKLLLGRNIEDAWITSLNDLRTLDFLSKVAEDFDMKLGIDFASSELWNGKLYAYEGLRRKLDREKQMELILDTAEKYNLYYLEDPLQQEDFRGHSGLMSRLGGKRLIVGDDLFCTNPGRLGQGLKAANGIIIKPNQIGTLSLTRQVIDMAVANGITTIPSHRSVESMDPWLADISVTFDSPLIKIGACPCDIAKYNRLIELWNEIPNVRMAELPF